MTGTMAHLHWRLGSRVKRWVFLLLLLYMSLTVVAKDELYKILGVSRTATKKEIKSAYRKKALDTHPDKNTGVPPEQAAEEFRKVVEAFEILSDEKSRSRYDRTGRTDAGSSGSGGQRQRRQGHHGTQFTWNFQRRTYRLKDKFEVQQAQSRLLHVVSLDQLKTIMLDDEGRLERNLLICFVTAGRIEQHAEDEMVFPYPFAGTSSQGIWWEDLLQTVQIRYHKSNELTDFFKIPHGGELRTPLFLFGKRGQLLTDPFSELYTSKRQAFENWMWTQISVEAIFENQHPHPVEVYWINGRNGKPQFTVEPGEQKTINTMLTHEFYVRDARVDTRRDAPNRNRLTSQSSLGSYKIVNDTTPQIIVIEAKECFDLSGHCVYWRRQGECIKNPSFMEETCRLSCEHCDPNAPVVRESDQTMKQETAGAGHEEL